jgi:hypothetical protein
VTYGNGVFVALAGTGANRVMTSADGVTWTARSAAEASSWKSVTYGNGVFVAVSSSWTNRVMTSTDGVTWTKRTTAESGTWNSVTYGTGVFVAVSGSGSNRVMTSSLVQLAAPASPTSLVAYRGYNSAEIAFTAGADGGAAITNYKYSTDNGSSWNAFSPAVTSSSVTIGGLTNGMTYNIKLRAVNAIGDGAVSDAVSVTPAVVDAITWTARTAAAANGWRSVVYGNGVFVAVAGGGTNRVMTSTDGVTWTARSAAAASSWNSVTYGNGVFVAVAYSGWDRVMTSADGVTWTARSAAEANSWNSVTYGNGMFVAVANSGSSRVMTSTDGVTWTARSAAEANSWNSVTYGNGVFVAVAYSGSSRVMTSTDGVTWTARTAAEANGWNSVTYGNGLFVAVANSGWSRVMTSADGVTWTARTAAEANGWNSVTFGNGVYVAVASWGTSRVMTSTDGVTWTARSAAEANDWRSVTYGNGVFVAVSPDGSNRVMTSSLAEPTAPAAPSALVATAGVNSASIAFTAGDNGGGAITKYQYKVGTGSWTDAVGTTSPITISGLTNYQSATIRLRAVNAVGNSSSSSPVSVIPRQAGPAVTSATPSGSKGIVVTFNLNPLPGTTVSYQSVVAYARGTNTVRGTCRTYARQATCYIGGLTRATDYDLRVTAYLPVPGKTWHNATQEGSILQVRTNR